jgi:mono/diheme cytochrome c family protein
MKSAFGIAVAGLVLAVGLAVQAQEQKTIWDGVYTLEQAGRGEKVYGEQCAQCHGETLSGVESAPPLTGDQFNNNWEGLALSDLFDRIRTTMPQTAPGTLSRAQNAEVVAHILKVGGFPAGEKPLDGAQGALTNIKYRTYKP